MPRPVTGGFDLDSFAGSPISRDDDHTRNRAEEFAGAKVADTRAPTAALADCDVAGESGSASAGGHGESVTGH